MFELFCHLGKCHLTVKKLCIFITIHVNSIFKNIYFTIRFSTRGAISEYETFLKKSATIANRDSSEIPSRLSAIKTLQTFHVKTADFRT